MSLLPLHLLGSPVLRRRSEEIGAPDDEVRRLVADMFETMDAARGVGLAANQVGVARRVAVVDADGDRFVMIDPVILESEGKATAEEGCLSIPEIYGDVTRPERVVLEATDLAIAFGGIRAGFHATTSINRFDFGLNWNAAIEAGGVVVADTVNITIDLEVVRQ